MQKTKRPLNTDSTNYNLSKAISAYKEADAAHYRAKSEIEDLAQQDHEYTIKQDSTSTTRFDLACQQSPLRAACTILLNGDIIFARFGQFFTHYRAGRLLGLAAARDYVNSEDWFPVIEFVVSQSAEQVA